MYLKTFQMPVDAVSASASASRYSFKVLILYYFMKDK